jgi:hypothetical protein
VMLLYICPHYNIKNSLKIHSSLLYSENFRYIFFCFKKNLFPHEYVKQIVYILMEYCFLFSFMYIVCNIKKDNHTHLFKRLLFPCAENTHQLSSGYCFSFWILSKFPCCFLFPAAFM